MPLIGGRPWKPDKWRKAQRAPLRTPPCECGTHSHERNRDGTWGRCRKSSCPCLGWHRPATCARCGAPVPAGTARCAETCQPRVTKQSTGEDGTDG